MGLTINIDVAPWYGHGKAENVLGKVCIFYNQSNTFRYIALLQACTQLGSLQMNMKSKLISKKGI